MNHSPCHRRAAAALLLALAGCAAEPPTEPSAGLVAPHGPSTFVRIQSEVFARSCAFSGCHAGSEPAAGLSLEPHRAFAALVGASPTNTFARQEGMLRVRAGSPSSSFLIAKLTGAIADRHGARMPLGSSALHPSTIEFIRQWVAAGAPVDGSVADTSLLDGAHHHGGGDFHPLAPPSNGFQLHLTPFSVRPHGEREVFFATGSKLAHPTYMTGFRVAMRDNSHHFTLYALNPGGAPLPIDEVRDRGSNNDEFLRPREFLFGTQEGDVSYSLPPGVGVAIDPGALMDLNLHAVNPGGDSMLAEAYVNVFTSDHVERIATPLLWSFHRFVIPAHSERTLHDTLAITEPLDLLMLTTHFHKHGRSFMIYVLDETGSRRVYENRQWDHPLIERYDEPIALRPGQSLRLEATYVNDTDVDIFYGPRADDEMCSIYGLVAAR